MKLNLYCRFNETGIGRHAHNFFHAMQARTGEGISVTSTNAEDPEDIRRMVLGQTPDETVLFFYLQKPDFLSLLKGQKIMWLVFETDNIPTVWRDNLAAYDAVWVPSQWGRDILVKCGIPADKICVMPEGVDAKLYKPDPRPHNGFVFLSVGKYEKRKGINELIQAFTAEFPQASYPDVFLHLKADFFMMPQLIQELKVQLSFDSRIRIFDGKKTDEEMIALYNSADAFIAPSRAEGWGLPCIEALACGLPVATTNYSGQTEYLRAIEGLYLPIAYEMEPVEDFLYDHFYKEIYAGEPYGSWARPEVSSIQQTMREIYENRDVWKEKAMRASAIIREKFDWSRTGEHAVLELAELPVTCSAAGRP